jgi:hypothetical protein
MKDNDKLNYKLKTMAQCKCIGYKGAVQLSFDGWNLSSFRIPYITVILKQAGTDLLQDQMLELWTIQRTQLLQAILYVES